MLETGTEMVMGTEMVVIVQMPRKMFKAYRESECIPELEIKNETR